MMHSFANLGRKSRFTESSEEVGAQERHNAPSSLLGKKLVRTPVLVSDETSSLFFFCDCAPKLQASIWLCRCKFNAGILFGDALIRCNSFSVSSSDFRLSSIQSEALKHTGVCQSWPDKRPRAQIILQQRTHSETAAGPKIALNTSKKQSPAASTSNADGATCTLVAVYVLMQHKKTVAVLVMSSFMAEKHGKQHLQGKYTKYLLN